MTPACAVLPRVAERRLAFTALISDIHLVRAQAPK
jgi:hypothetical protein